MRSKKKERDSPNLKTTDAQGAKARLANTTTRAGKDKSARDFQQDPIFSARDSCHYHLPQRD